MLFGVDFFFVEMSAPSMENTIVRARNSHESGVLCVLKIAPTAKNNKQRVIADAMPVSEPHRSASRPEFFLVAINPPKKADVYIAKKESADR